MPLAPLIRLRRICLALPEAQEKTTWGISTFRVRDKIFATAHDRGTVCCKAPPGAQAILVGVAPERFFVPPYVGHKGWIGIRLDRATDWDEVGALIRRSYRLTAPKRLAQLVPEADQASNHPDYAGISAR
jgi:predicted DNA-binding protein (MmcQ/YjbR family)